MRTIITFLLLCSAAFADGPLFSIWHIDGHGYAWQQAQRDAGLPIEYTIRMASFFEGAANSPKRVAVMLDANATYIQAMNGQDVVLRMNNIGPELDKSVPRVSPLDDTTWRQSHMCIVRLADGTLDDTPVVSPWAGVSVWIAAGEFQAHSLFMRRLQEYLPLPRSWILRENNEGGRVALSKLWEQVKPRMLNHKNVYVWADASTPPDKYVHPTTLQPLTPDWRRVDSTTALVWRWKPKEVLDAEVDLRADEWIGTRRDQYPPTLQAEFYALENAQYRAYYDSFEANLTVGWQGNCTGNVGYGGWDENQQNTAASPPLYLAYYRPDYLTARTLVSGQTGNYYDWIPGYAAECDAQSANWNELSVGVNKKIIYAGVKAGKHAAVDPASYAGYMSWAAWVLHATGQDVRLVGWEGYQTKPTQRLFTDADAPLLAQISRSDLLTVTIEDYELALLREFDRVHEHPVLNRYWREGTTTVLTSPLNTATATKVYATETAIPGEVATLLYVFTPCDMSGEIEVGAYRVPAKRCGYYLTGQTVEVQ